jgi:hypothetical protein
MPIGRTSLQIPTPIDIRRELTRMNQRNASMGTYKRNAGNGNGLQSALYDPLAIVDNRYGNLRTADRYQNRSISCRTLRRVASKAWLISVCKLNIIRHIEPFLKPSTDKNLRGFVILKNGEDISKVYGHKSKEAETVEKFLLNTGFEQDDDREDTFTKYCNKILNDFFDLDQIATEIRYTMIGKPYDFWAVDAATIEKVIPGQENPYKIRYIQVIDHIPYAFYTKDEMIFDYQNGRTDLQYSFYGYSYVEQCIDLITAFINAFAYNSGYFTENKLPRGMLLIDGDASQETVESMEDYLYDIMSGNPSSQWRIPIIPSGRKKAEGDNTIKFVPLNSTNKDMEFQAWNDYLSSGICSVWGTSIDDIGLHSAKSQPMFEGDSKHKYEENRIRVLGNVLGYLQAYLNRIIAITFPGFRLEFVGYEKDDPKQILDIDKEEVNSYKTLNEKRKEKGLKELDFSKIKNPADLPMSQPAIQLFQYSQGGMSGMADMDGMEGMEDEEGSPGDFGDGSDQEAGEAPENEGEDFGGGSKAQPSGDFGKSMQNKSIRIVI